MILTAALLFSQTSAAPQAPSPAALISAMMKRYAEANTLTGTVVAEVRSNNELVRVTTEIQYQRPNLIHIKQVQEYKGRTVFYLISDGKQFQYTNPIDYLRKRDPFLVETAIQESIAPTTSGKLQSKFTPLSLGAIYAAGSQSLADRSIPLDMAVARTEDLQYFTGQLVELNDGGTETFDGRATRVVKGPWRPFADAAKALAEYELFITDSNDIAGYRLKENFMVNGQTVPLTSTWVSRFKVNGPVDAGLFALRLR